MTVKGSLHCWHKTNHNTLEHYDSPTEFQECCHCGAIRQVWHEFVGYEKGHGPHGPRNDIKRYETKVVYVSGPNECIGREYEVENPFVDVRISDAILKGIF